MSAALSIPRSRADCMPTRTPVLSLSKRSALPHTARSYQPLTGLVEGSEAVQLLQKEMFYLTQSIKRKDHNYRTPETTLLSESC